METIPFGPVALAGLVKLIKSGEISGKIAKNVMEKMFEGEGDPETIVKDHGWAQMSDSGELENIIKQVIADHPKSVSDIADGNKKAYGFLTGQVMRATKGQANPQMANQIIRKLVEEQIGSAE